MGSNNSSSARHSPYATDKDTSCYFPKQRSNVCICSLQQMALLGFLPTTLYRGTGNRSHELTSRVTPDWDLSDAHTNTELQRRGDWRIYLRTNLYFRFQLHRIPVPKFRILRSISGGAGEALGPVGLRRQPDHRQLLLCQRTPAIR